MYKDHKISVVIPAYNEEAFIGDVITNIPDYVDNIFVVDDASTDKTSESVNSINDPRVKLSRNPSNRGVGGSMLIGYQLAIDCNADIAVKIDGDGQMSAPHLPNLLDPIIDDNYDYAKGNRFIEGHGLSNMPRIRLIGNIILTFFTKLASGYWHVFDPQNGYTAIRVKSLKSLKFDHINEGYFFENDMLVQLNIHKYRVKDVSIPAKYGNEVSHLKIRKIIGMFSILLIRRFIYRIYNRYVLRDFSPIILFGFFGTIFLTWGTLFGLYTWILGSAPDAEPAPAGTVMLSVLPFFIGFQLLLQALVLDIYETPK